MPKQPTLMTDVTDLDGVARGLAWTTTANDEENPHSGTGSVRFKLADIPKYAGQAGKDRRHSQTMALEKQIDKDLTEPVQKAFDLKRLRLISFKVEISEDIATVTVRYEKRI